MITILLSALINISGAEYIEAGEEELQKGNWEKSISFFKEALSSDLGPPANATCYWNMYIAYDQLNKYDDAAQSLFMFRETTLFFKEFLNDVPVGHPGFIWIARAGIEDKLIYSKALIDIYWMKKNNYYCRSEMYSCSIPFTKMVGLYANKLPFCKSSGIANTRIPNPSSNLNIEVDCLNGTVEKYYFTYYDGKRIL